MNYPLNRYVMQSWFVFMCLKTLRTICFLKRLNFDDVFRLCVVWNKTCVDVPDLNLLKTFNLWKQVQYFSEPTINFPSRDLFLSHNKREITIHYTSSISNCIVSAAELKFRPYY